jgi:hypothetical protein
MMLKVLNKKYCVSYLILETDAQDAISPSLGTAGIAPNAGRLIETSTLQNSSRQTTCPSTRHSLNVLSGITAYSENQGKVSPICLTANIAARIRRIEMGNKLSSRHVK